MSIDKIILLLIIPVPIFIILIILEFRWWREALKKDDHPLEFGRSEKLGKKLIEEMGNEK